MTRRKNKNLGDDVSFPTKMKLNQELLFPEPPLVDTNLVENIKQAILNRLVIEFYYNDLHRITEPHILRRTDKGLKVEVHQVGGQSKRNESELPSRRDMYLHKISKLKITDQTFSIKPGFSDDPSLGDEIIASVYWSE